MTLPPRTFVQLPEAPGDWDTAADYRQGFRDWVKLHARRGIDSIVVVEPDPARAAWLRDYWADTMDALVVEQEIASGQGPTHRGPFWIARDDAGAPVAAAADRDLVRALAPSRQPVAEGVETRGIADLLREMSERGPIELLSIDPRDRDFSEDDWRSIGAVAVRQVSVVTLGASTREAKAIDRTLRAAGFHRAGRAWGAALTQRLYAKSDDARQRLIDAANETRVSLGRSLVAAREAWPDEHRRKAARHRIQQRLGRAAGDARSPQDARIPQDSSLDAEFGRQLQPEDRRRIRQWAQGLRNSRGTWTFDDCEVDVLADARNVHARHGVWPISFSFPGAPLPVNPQPEELVAPIFPGYPYAFDDVDQYMRTYHAATFGITHRKAGWDCFRHVEIMAAGAVTLMLDAARIPPSSMVHYPKRRMAELVRHAEAGEIPDERATAALRAHFTQHLTSRAMADYLLKSAGLEGAERILFIDGQLPTTVDYQSVLTLIGLKQLRGASIVTAFPADWIYEDHAGSVAHLYGRGFGYTRSVHPGARSPRDGFAETDGLEAIDNAAFDTVVVGSISRNQHLIPLLEKTMPSERMIWIHGEDLPPTQEEAAMLRRSGAHIFVRAIHD